jgi:hypothetical protein
VAIDDDFSHVNGHALVFLEGVTLKALLIGVARYGRQTVAQFRVESVDKGAEQWHALNTSHW